MRYTPCLGRCDDFDEVGWGEGLVLIYGDVRRQVDIGDQLTAAACEGSANFRSLCRATCLSSFIDDASLAEYKAGLDRRRFAVCS